MKIGYLRGPQAVAQRLELKRQGCTRAYEARQQALDALQKGDVFVVLQLDRAADTMTDLAKLIEEVEERGAKFQSVADEIDTSTERDRRLLHFMRAMIKAQSEFVSRRTRTGLRKAVKHGQRLGRPNVLSSEQIKQARSRRAAGEHVTDIATDLSVSVPTLYRATRAGS